MDGVVEIITGRERRRRWSTEDKLRLVAEMAEPGTRVRAVAARHGVCESLLFTWRRQVREGVLVAPETPGVHAGAGARHAPGGGWPVPSRAASSSAHHPRRSGPRRGLIEIELGDGRQVRVGADVNQAALRRVLAALRG